MPDLDMNNLTNIILDFSIFIFIFVCFAVEEQYIEKDLIKERIKHIVLDTLQLKHFLFLLNIIICSMLIK